MKMTAEFEVAQKNYQTCRLCGALSDDQIQNEPLPANIGGDKIVEGFSVHWPCKKCGAHNRIECWTEKI